MAIYVRLSLVIILLIVKMICLAYLCDFLDKSFFGRLFLVKICQRFAYRKSVLREYL